MVQRLECGDTEQTPDSGDHSARAPTDLYTTIPSGGAPGRKWRTIANHLCHSPDGQYVQGHAEQSQTTRRSTTVAGHYEVPPGYATPGHGRFQFTGAWRYFLCQHYHSLYIT